MATNSKARSINIFLLDGETDGVRSAQIAMSTIHAIAFVSKDENLTKSHARFVESLLIAAAKASKAWAVMNSQNPTDLGKLPKPDECAMLEFVDQTKTLTSALGFDLFKVTTGKLSSQPDALSEAAATGIDSPPFRYSGGDFDATAIVSGSTGEWVVKAGSKARLQETNTPPKGAKARRAELLDKQVLKDIGTALEFTADYAFSSASQAASVVGGGSVAGPQVWKLNGKTYGDWEAERSGLGLKAESLPDLLTQLG